MITPEMIERINVLANKSKSVGLTQEEKEEQSILRNKYLEGFRKNFRGQLDRIRFIEDER